ncbi:hypothetical protein BDZ97DRAFT_1903997 [Flammula alnicola]|nr:hypothetical protein BDZ97DRAFT_1903997 [Flammula alnicola]
MYARSIREWILVVPPRTNGPRMTSPEDALAFAGFEKCASSREYFWHLAADQEAQYDRFPGAQSWEWIPGGGCENLAPLNPEALNHFFSLSCISTLTFSRRQTTLPSPTLIVAGRKNSTSRLLAPSSIAIPPKGFNISLTPLVTFRRIDLLLSKEELIDIHRSIQTQALEDDGLFSNEAVWTLPLAEYLSEFLAPLPDANYATMVVSTGGHWTTTLFSKVSPPGMQGVMSLFEAAMQRWAQKLQDALSEHSGHGRFRRSRKRVIVRAYLPGHESCHDFRQPWTEIQPFVWNWYNWGDIWQFNAIFGKLLHKYQDIHYLPIDRPARLRPDAHTTGDCLHVMAGSGVLEGWTHYIWHFVTNLP